MKNLIINIISIVFLSLIITTTKLLILTNIIENTTLAKIIEFVAFISMLPFFIRMTIFHIRRTRETERQNKYVNKLNLTLINQSHNPLFYEGELTEGARILTRDVVENTNIDRCCIWLFNQDKTAIEMDMLYEKKSRLWSTGGTLYCDDYKPYFEAISKNSFINASDAHTHYATSCFDETYLKPFGIKSMLDVPILYRGEVIGIICLENKESRQWVDAEINFAQFLSSLYSFAWSIAEGNEMKQNLLDIENFLDTASLVSKTDERGRIIYANEKFATVSKWDIEDVIGQDHNILNSGVHDKTFWQEMYEKTAIRKEIWNAVITNKAKDGSLYYVDTYVKADFDPETGILKGYTSIRQDVTKIIESSMEIENKNTYLEHAAKIIRHDMHSGINTYIPRGINSLIRRLTPEIIKSMKLEAPIKMLKEGLIHTQRVYKGVYEFTNLVKKDGELEKELLNTRNILENYLSSTAYRESVMLSEYLPTIEVNESLFCTAIDNLIRNGLKYNDSPTRVVAIYQDSEDTIAIQDNGRGLTQEEFDEYSKPYKRKPGQKEAGTGLGLNICIAILKEHGFEVSCEKVEEGGTKIKIKYKK